MKNTCPESRLLTLLAVSTAVLTAVLSAQEPEAPHLAAAARVFGQLPPREQVQVLDAVEAATLALDDPHRSSLRTFADAAAKPPRPRMAAATRRGTGSETGVRQASGTLDGLPFRPTVVYQFGSGRIGPRPGCQPRGANDEARARTGTLLAALAGHPARADFALAGLMQALDDERAVDPFAHVLETWRNGAETFYEALERTAGSGNGLFCYDAMFADWQRTCVPRNHPDRRRLTASSDDASRGFQASFANYWRHRAQIEAMAVTLALGATVPLPANLARFEAKSGSDHSMRECMLLLLAAHGGDVAATVRAYTAAMPRLPEPLWQGKHDPFAALQRLFAATMPRLLELAPSTDDLLARCRTDAGALRERSSRAAWDAFQRALPAKARAGLGPFAGR